MKRFQLDFDRCTADHMEKDSLMILTTVIKERILDQPSPSKLVSQEAQAERGSLELESKLKDLDKRLKRGLQLLVDKVPKKS